MTDKFERLKAKMLANAEVRAAYEALGPAFDEEHRTIAERVVSPPRRRKPRKPEAP